MKKLALLMGVLSVFSVINSASAASCREQCVDLCLRDLVPLGTSCTDSCKKALCSETSGTQGSAAGN